MAKTVSITTPSQRAKLAQRRSPYAYRIGKGTALLYYRGVLGGTWKSRTPVRGDRAIGPEGKMSFEEALAVVLERLDDEKARVLPADVKAGQMTVREAWRAYEDNALKTKSAHGHSTICGHGKLILTAFGDRRLDQLAVTELTAWRNGLVRTEGRKHRKRSQSTANKIVASLKAALNATGARGGWRDLKKFRDADGTRDAVFTADEVRAVVTAAYGQGARFGQLVEGLAVTGARFGELAACRVGHVGDRVLTIPAGKTGGRNVTLTPGAAAFFRDLAAGRDKSAPLFTRDGKAPWTNAVEMRTPWARAMKAAELQPAATPYVLRHSYITLALYAAVPPLTVAKSVGTSLAMIDKTYGKVLAEMQADALSRMDDVLQIRQAQLLRLAE